MGSTLNDIDSRLRSSALASAIRPIVHSTQALWKSVSRYPRYLYRFGIEDGHATYNALYSTEKKKKVRLHIPQISSPIALRPGTADVPVFEQVYIDLEYDFPLPDCPQFMVDAGAHIGLASLYFAHRFPSCQILSLEPEPRNFELLKENTRAYSNITPMQTALWGNNTTLNIKHDQSENWAFRMEENQRDTGTPAITVEEARSHLGASTIDILKMDIEGAEKEVMKKHEDWIENVNSIIVELHGKERIEGSKIISKIRRTKDLKKRKVMENVILTKN